MPPTWVYLIFPLILIQIYWKFQLSKQTAAANWCSSAALQVPINLPWHETNCTILEVSYCSSHSPGISTVQFNIFLITLFLHCYLCLSLYIQNNTLVSTTIGSDNPVNDAKPEASSKSCQERFIISGTKPWKTCPTWTKCVLYSDGVLQKSCLLARAHSFALPLKIVSHTTFFLHTKRSLLEKCYACKGFDILLKLRGFMKNFQPSEKPANTLTDVPSLTHTWTKK